MNLVLALLLTAQDAPKPIELWPGRAPGETADGGPDKMDGPKKVVEVTKPTITVYRPAADKNTGLAIVVAPGGGYRMLAYEHEGTQVAEWLTSIGATCVLLRYRIPGRPGDDDRVLPLQDAQRAVSLTRSKAAEWGVDPARIGILGFSAGGHLAAHSATQGDKRAYEAVDDADKASCRPDFAVMIYPGGILDRQDKTKLAARIAVGKDTPPSFLVVSTDDKGSAPGTLVLYSALRDAGVPVELHVYADGGHGYGMRKAEKPWAAWPKRCEEWLAARGLFKKSS
jgi:acetyl esterase/lipase